MTSHRVRSKPRHILHILALGTLLLGLSRSQQAFVAGNEAIHVPTFSVSLAVSSLNTLRTRPCFYHSRRPYSATIFFLLLISGDIEVNPGPIDNQPVPARGDSLPVLASGNSQLAPASML